MKSFIRILLVWFLLISPAHAGLWESESGDVTLSAVIADNAVVRGDGGIKGIQDSGILVDDSDLMTFPATAGAGVLLPIEDDAVTPTFAWGDGGYGFYSPEDDIILVGLTGSFRYTFALNNFTAEGSITSAPTTIPGIEFTDSDGADEDVSAGILHNLTTITSGAEVGDMSWQVMGGAGTAGTVETFMQFDGSERLFTLLGPALTDSNAANTVAIQTFENTAGDFQIFRTDADPENSVTGSIGDLSVDGTNGIIYIKNTGSATNTGWEVVGGLPTFKDYSMSNPGTADTFYIGGHYDYSGTDSTLTIGGSVTQTFGSTGDADGGHAFIVASGAGGTDLVLTVTGVSITDAGVRNDSDTEIIVADTDAATTDQYFETSKKWLGQITYTLTGSAGAFTFNYGFSKYEDFGNRNFTITDFEGTGQARANETGLNIELLHHEPTAFVYSAGAFVPNQTALVSMATDYGTNNNVSTGDNFAYKRAGLSTLVTGSNGQGVIIRVTTAVNNSINHANFHVGVLIR